MRVSVIIVNWNAGSVLYNCIHSLRKDLDLIKDIYVVDNNSTDNSLERIENLFDNITIIKNSENLGYSKAVNKALSMIKKEDYVLVLNPDTEMRGNALRKMVEYMDEDFESGMLGPKLINSDGSFQLASKRSIPTPEVAFYKMSGLSRMFPKSEKFGKYNLTFLDENKIQFVEAISGSCMFARRSVIDKVGFMDEDYFMYGEDLDWCYRFGKAGWKIVYYPQAEVMHHHRVSSRKRPVSTSYSFYQAMYIFYKKHFKKWFIADCAIVGAIVAAGGLAVGKSFLKNLFVKKRKEKE
ncbi:MAG: glycosyltransferase family 2 protein [Armatimonadota bacterium]